MMAGWPVCELDRGNQRLLTPPLSLECVCRPPFPQCKPFSRTVLRDNCLPDWICDWNQLRPHYKILRSWLAGVRIDSSCVLETNLIYVSLFIKPATYQSGRARFFLPSLLALCVGEAVSDFTQEVPKGENQHWNNDWDLTSLYSTSTYILYGPFRG